MSDTVTAESIKIAYPDVYASIEHDAFARGQAAGLAAGRDDGLKEGAAAERDRIKDVEAQCIPGHEALIADLKYDGVTSGPQAAVKILAAEKKLRETTLSDFQADHTKVAAPAVPPAPGEDKAKEAAADEALPPEERAKKTWDADPAVRAEFKNDFNAYKAFVIAEAKGQVKIYRGGK